MYCFIRTHIGAWYSTYNIRSQHLVSKVNTLISKIINSLGTFIFHYSYHLKHWHVEVIPYEYIRWQYPLEPSIRVIFLWGRKLIICLMCQSEHISAPTLYIFHGRYITTTNSICQTAILVLSSMCKPSPFWCDVIYYLVVYKKGIHLWEG